MQVTKTVLTWWDVQVRAAECVHKSMKGVEVPIRIHLFGVPRGGIPAALLVLQAMEREFKFHSVSMTNNVLGADFIIDDVIDSGETFRKYNTLYPGIPFLPLYDKQGEDKEMGWIHFPWEQEETEQGPEDNIRRILQYIGEDPNRDGLKETPSRVVRSYAELFAGYKKDPKELFKTFEETSDEMVILRNTPFVSYCEHHLMPFTGRAAIAYVPKDKVIGLSKLARLLDVYARRLQIQERLTKEITRDLDQYLQPLGSACVIEASHSCMSCRGVNKVGPEMVTSSLTGVFRTKPEARAELFSLISRSVS